MLTVLFMKKHALGSHAIHPPWVRLIGHLCLPQCSVSVLLLVWPAVLRGAGLTAQGRNTAHSQRGRMWFNAESSQIVLMQA